MYAVIKTGGKQYRVQAGDVLVVEKLDGEPGAKLAFDQVLMIGEGESVTLGAPTVDGASVGATLIETRKGEKIKVFKKIRRQGYRRTKGHRQQHSVLRVTSLVGAGLSETWEGEVDLTPLAELNARARNLARGMEAAAAKSAAKGNAPVAKAAKPAAAKAAPAKAPKAEAAPEVKAAPEPKAEAKAAPAAKAAPKKAAAPKAEAAPKTEAKAQAKAPAKKAAAKPAAAKADAPANKPADKPKKAAAPKKKAD